jgi:hypothetical protein
MRKNIAQGSTYTLVTELNKRPQYPLYPDDMVEKSLTTLSDANATLTAAQLVTSGIFVITPTAARTLITDSVANILEQSYLSNYSAGTAFEFTVINLAAYDVTLAAGTNVTLVGNMKINNSSATFMAVVVSDSAISVYRKTGGVSAGEILAAYLADGAATTAKIADKAITAAKIADATITATQISSTAGIAGTQIADGTLTGAQISSSAAIAASKLNIRHNYSKSSTSNPSATAATYGTAVNLTPASGYGSLFPIAMNIVFGGTFSSETVTANITVTYGDATTASLTKTATATGTVTLTSTELMGLVKDGTYITQVSVESRSTIASSAATVVFNHCGFYL